MSEVYRKRGRVAHYEHGQVIVVTEAGEASEEGNSFRVSPLREEVHLPELDAEELASVARSIEASVRPPLRLERLIVSHGVASHEFAGRSWSDETRRIHASIASTAGVRALVDRGDFALGEIARITHALARCEGERPAPPRVRLAPNVTAALIPILEGVAPPNVGLWQASGGVDGKGNDIHEHPIHTPPWPNWYRPSYRVRPVRMPINVHLRCEVDFIDRDLPEAVAILAPVSGLVIRVLIEQSGQVFASAVRVARIDAVGRETCWYPYGAGTFGAEVML